MSIIKTGIDGLDKLLNGGLIENRTILVQGGPGTGKSTLGLQFLVNGIVNADTPAVLLSMDAEVSDIIADMSAFGWPLKELIEQDKLRIITPPGGFEEPSPLSVDEIINFIYDHVTEIDAKRLVIDSLNSLEVNLANTDFDRQNLLRFISLIRDLGCTTLLLAEKQDVKTHPVYTFIAHGVINLYNFRRGASRLRAIEVVKMRGLNHSTLTHSMNIEPEKGIVVLPHEIDMEI